MIADGGEAEGNKTYGPFRGVTPSLADAARGRVNRARDAFNFGRAAPPFDQNS